MIATQPTAVTVRPASARQLDILNAIRAFIRQHHFPPTVREVGNAVGLSSSSTVYNHLVALKLKGYIDWRPDQERTIVVLADWQ